MTVAASIAVTDMHTAGEPVRIVERGYPELTGATILEKRRDALQHHDALRRMLMLEPRGHGGMYGVIPTAPCATDADLAVLFTHQEGYSTMCGHATIAIGRWAVDTGRVALIDGRAAFNLEVPCGIVRVSVEADGEEAPLVAFESVDAFVDRLDHDVATRFGSVSVDIAFGGAFYAILPASRIGLSLSDVSLDSLVRAGIEITEALRATTAIVHPSASELGFLYGTILTDDVNLGAPGGPASSNLCVFADGQVDRSPTGSGITARLALAAARGTMEPGHSCEIRGASGAGFRGTLVSGRQSERGLVSRVRVAGRAYYSGRAELVAERGDPFADGFALPHRLRDMPSR